MTIRLTGIDVHTPDEEFNGYSEIMDRVADELVSEMEDKEPSKEEIKEKAKEKIRDVVGDELDIGYLLAGRNLVFDSDYEKPVPLGKHATTKENPRWGAMKLRTKYIYRDVGENEDLDPDICTEKSDEDYQRKSCPRCERNFSNLGGHRGKKCTAARRNISRKENCLVSTSSSSKFHEFVRKNGGIYRKKTKYVPGSRSSKSSLNYKNFCEAIYKSLYRDKHINQSRYSNDYRKIVDSEEYIAVKKDNDVQVFKKISDYMGEKTRKRKFRSRPLHKRLFTSDGDLFARGPVDVNDVPEKMRVKITVEVV